MAMVGEIATLITAKTAPFTKGIGNARKSLTGFTSQVKGKLTGALSGMVSGFGAAATAAVGLGGAVSVVGLALRAMKLASAAEDAEVMFTTFLKSGEKAKKMLKELKAFSDATPFSGKEIIDAGKQLVAFGFDADKTTETLQTLGDIAAGTQKPIMDYVNILGKVKSGITASLGDVQQLSDRGANLIPEIGRHFNMAEKDVKKFVSAGNVGFGAIYEILQKMTKEGGLFQNAMANMSETTSGRFSTLKSKIDEIFSNVGTEILKGLNLKGLTEEITELAVKYKADIVNATKDAIVLLKTVLSHAPAWITTIVREIDRWRKGYALYNPSENVWGLVTPTGLAGGVQAFSEGGLSGLQEFVKPHLNVGKTDRETLAEIERRETIRQVNAEFFQRGGVDIRDSVPAHVQRQQAEEKAAKRAADKRQLAEQKKTNELLTDVVDKLPDTDAEPIGVIKDF